MKLGLKTITGALFALFAGVAFATPVYTGDTDGSDFGLNPPRPTDSGYYIWSTSSTDWSIRWTGNNNGDTEIYNWFGSILVATGDLDTTYSIQFESGGAGGPDYSGDMTVPFTGDLIWWNAVAGSAWDGIDFTLLGDTQVIQFTLGSTMFDQMIVNECLVACDSLGIYVSDEYYMPQVRVAYENGHMFQNFEISSVPEPGTLALLGLGLLGMGASRRKARS